MKTRDGKIVKGGLQPLNAAPPLVTKVEVVEVVESAPVVVEAAPIVVEHHEVADDERRETVREFLSLMRESIAVQRDVMLGFLGAGVPAAPAMPATPPAVEPASNGNGAHAPVDVPANGSRGAGGAGGNGARRSPAPLPAPARAPAPAPAPVAAAPAAAPVATATLTAPQPTADELLAAVLDVVAERTGYPPDMLDPDQDLEADLSIDSIKRIEILSELADRVGLPGSESGEIEDSVIEELAQLKTMRGIVDWIVAARPAGVDVAPAPAPAPVAAAPVAAPVATATLTAPQPTADELLAAVLDVVAERTGYPPDMLDPDQDLEADLSIDSIKRIEILSELADRVGLPGSESGEIEDSVIEELAQLKTMRGIVDWIVAARPAGVDVAPAPAPAPVRPRPHRRPRPPSPLPSPPPTNCWRPCWTWWPSAPATRRTCSILTRTSRPTSPSTRSSASRSSPSWPTASACRARSRARSRTRSSRSWPS